MNKITLEQGEFEGVHVEITALVSIALSLKRIADTLDTRSGVSIAYMLWNLHELVHDKHHGR